ncbi:hypothetical protein BGX21_009769 [Mortierella sp. AD011]|nr:hypothetical protein BGX21_009769 [Mortierella sp. AD011]
MTLKMELRSIQRVMKVFKADNLKEILKVAEQAIVWPENFSDSSYAVFESLSEGNPGGASSARPDATSVFLSSMVNALQRQIQQLEGHQYKYEALFLVEGPGRSKIRMILTKLGNAVDIRQERLAALEAKSKSAAEQTGLSALTSAISNIFAQPAPTTVSQDTSAYLSELKGLRDTMTMIGEIFDLYPSVVTSFEKQHQGTQDRGSTLTAEQLEALIPPLEEEESAGLLRPEKQRKYVPRGLVKRSVDEVKASGPRAEQLVLTYEIEFIVKLTRRAEDYLTPKTVPQRRVQELRTTTTTRVPEISNVKISGYDVHVEPVYHWERPGQASSTITRQRFTRPAEPRYTIDVQDIEG